MSQCNVYRDGYIHVCKTMCPTCIFRPGNQMDLAPGRVAGMVRDALTKDGCIPCHSTLYGQNGGLNAVCRGFFDGHAPQTLQVASRLGRVKFVEIEK